ncbi:hypothetical protein LJB42_001529 [Komagataella kurtzmanii]|nr:hypothetical protein LJB42_001529 [Komagataella kurtzmanii]
MSRVRGLASTLLKELQETSKHTLKDQQKVLQKRNEAMAAYRKIQASREGKSEPQVEDQQHLNPIADISFIDHILQKEHSLDPKDELHVENLATFVANHREYCILLERYNPGISMTQENKVRKTARRVGLEVPEDVKS